MAFLVRFLARLRRLVCTGGDFLVVMLLFLLHLLAVRYVAGVVHGNLAICASVYSSKVRNEGWK